MSTILKNKVYRFPLHPNKMQESILNKLFGCTRKVYNYGVEINRKHHKNTRNSFSFFQFCKYLTAFKKLPENSFLYDVSAVPLQQALKQLSHAYKNYKKGITGKPGFRKKSEHQSAKFTGQSFQILRNKVKLAKIPELISFNDYRDIPSQAQIQSVTIIRECTGKYFLCVHVLESIAKLDKVDNKIGVDVGIQYLIVLSDGTKIVNPKFMDQLLKKLRRAQRVLSRRKYLSKNWYKTKLKVARIHERIKNLRHDMLHKLTAILIRENQAIGIESLRIKNMMKNKHLSKMIADAGWATFRKFLEYKAEWYGRDVVPLDTFFPSSKTCHTCGHKLDNLPLSIRQWTCPQCLTNHDRDINAAINIQKHTVGMTEIYACGDNVRPASTEAKVNETGNIKTVPH